MQKAKLKKRDVYLNRMIAFQDTEMIKVMTGIRRYGKSSLMKLMAEYLWECGISDTQIIEMNFECDLPQTQYGIRIVKALDFLLE